MKVLAFLLLFCSLAFCSPTRESYSESYKARVQNGELQKVIDEATDNMVSWTVYQLRIHNQEAYALQMESEWASLEARGMLDHKPISEWLSQKGFDIELLLGSDLFKSLRLNDLFFTLNYAPPVVLLCEDNVAEGEYADDWVSDTVYGNRGLGQILVYWGSVGACTGLTWGTCFLFCDPIAMGAEWLSLQTWIPLLNKPLWEVACHQLPK